MHETWVYLGFMRQAGNRASRRCHHAMGPAQKAMRPFWEERKACMSTPDFDSIRHVTVLGQDYWSARELMPLLGYGQKWQNFAKVIAKALQAA